MKFLILASVIATILGDYGSYQGNPIDGDIERLQQFKEYALGLVSAGAKSFLTSKDLVEGGCECLSGIDVNKFMNPYDAIYATMLIARDHNEGLQVIRETSESDLHKLKVADGLKKNIRLILLVLQSALTPTADFSDYEFYAKYLVKHKTAVAGTSDDDEISESALKCYQTMTGLQVGTNERYVDEFLDGCKIISKLMTRDNDKDRIKKLRSKLDRIINLISESEMNPPPHKSKEQLKEFLQDLKDSEDLQ